MGIKLKRATVEEKRSTGADFTAGDDGPVQVLVWRRQGRLDPLTREWDIQSDRYEWAASLHISETESSILLVRGDGHETLDEIVTQINHDIEALVARLRASHLEL